VATCGGRVADAAEGVGGVVQIRRPGILQHTGSPYTPLTGTSERDPDFRKLAEDRVSTLVDISSQEFSVTFQPFKEKKLFLLWRGKVDKQYRV
jgi:hypothetical protein